MDSPRARCEYRWAARHFGGGGGDDQGPSLLKKIYRQISRFVPELVFEFLEMAYNLPAGRQLARSLGEKQYDLLYERYAIFNWAGIRKAKSRGVPFILEVNYTAQTPLYRHRSPLLKPLACRVDRYLFQQADGIVVVSTYLRDHLKNIYGVSEEKIIILPNAADPDIFSPRGEEKPVEYKTVIGFVGGFYPWHGLDLLCKAMASMDVKKLNVSVVLIGDGPQRAFINALVEALGLNDSVVFMGSVDHKVLPKYIATFDVAVMPNSNEYGSPMKVFEYMAMGIPVVAPALGPLMDGIDHGVEGLLFKPNDSQSLAYTLEQLIQDEPRRKVMGQAGRKRVLSRHNWMANATAVIQLLKEKIL